MTISGRVKENPCQRSTGLGLQEYTEGPEEDGSR